MSEVLSALLRINLAAGLALMLVMALRLPARRLFGARIAYGVWSLPALAALAMVAPPRVVRIVQMSRDLEAAAGPDASLPIAALPLHPQADAWPWLAALWVAGGLASLAWLGWRQAQFARAVRAGRAGPAVVGVLRPRIVTPTDFANRYTPREQQVVLAHEASHIVRQDSRVNALVALARCANWFNPLVHLGAHYLRIDQELACDARVVATHPGARRAYAEAMLKTQLAARPLPLGCYWPAPSAHPLAERIRLLSHHTPGPWVRGLGAAVVALTALGCGVTAWAARPAQVVVTEVAAPAPPLALGATPLSTPATTAVRPDAAARITLARQSTPTAATQPAPAADVPGPAALTPPAPGERKLQPGDFGSPDWPHRFHTGSGWSRVEPGAAVRVLATMTDPDGVPLTTDLTTFGSQSLYRLGYVRRSPSSYKLFTSVVQDAGRFTVTASLQGGPGRRNFGSVTLASGETGQVRLTDGQVVRVTPIARPESAEELAFGQRMGPRPYVRVDRVWRP